MQPNNDKRSFTPVMDVQQPRPASPPPQPPKPVQQPTVIQPANGLGRPATMEYTRPRPQDPSAPTFSPDSKQNFTPQSQNSLKPKKTKKGLVIGLFVFLFVGLAAGGSYYYLMVMKKDTAPVQQAAQPQPTTTTDDTKIEATPEGVDKATSQIDQKLNSLDDTKDFSSNDVSDEGLGI